MNVTDVVVVAGGIGLIAVLAWYFFAPQTATKAEVAGGRQTVDILVRGGYSPNLVRVVAGTPVRLRFNRQDNSDCTSRVVFPDFRRSASLAPFATTTMDVTVDEPGEYAWACGMNLLHGTLIAEPAGGGPARDGQSGSRLSGPDAGGDEVAEAARGVTEENRETARAVGVGPRLES